MRERGEGGKSTPVSLPVHSARSTAPSVGLREVESRAQLVGHQRSACDKTCQSSREPRFRYFGTYILQDKTALACPTASLRAPPQPGPDPRICLVLPCVWFSSGALFVFYGPLGGIFFCGAPTTRRARRAVGKGRNEPVISHSLPLLHPHLVLLTN